MAVLTAEARNALPNSSFAYIDSKGQRHLPIHDASHVHAALSRFSTQAFESDSARSSAHAKIAAAAKRFGITLANFSTFPPSLPPTGEPAVFAADVSAALAEEDDGWIVRAAKLFEAGDYPDKNFSLSPAELRDAAASFVPVVLDVGDAHGATVLEGKMGYVASVEASEDGQSLLGEVHIPAWLERALEGTTRSVSTEWDRATKRLTRLSLVKNPRVTDAALMAAFAASTTPAPDPAPAPAATAPTRHDTPSGQRVMQDIHDRAVIAGAVCTPPAAGSASMASQHEADAVQQIHDEAVAHGAVCETPSQQANPQPQAGNVPATSPTPQQAPSRQQAKPAPTRTFSRSQPMSKIRDLLFGLAKDQNVELDADDQKQLEAMFSGTAGDDTTQKPPPEATTQTNTGDTSAVSQASFTGYANAAGSTPDPKDAEIAALKAKQELYDATFARMAAERRTADSVAFSRNLVASHRITPAAAEKLAPVVERIIAADSTATFADGQPTTLSLLAAFAEALPDFSKFTTDQVKLDQVAALFTETKTEGVNGQPTPPTDEAVDKLLAMTPAGKATIAARRNGSQGA